MFRRFIRNRQLQAPAAGTSGRAAKSQYGRLQFEALETRTLLAVGPFGYSLPTTAHAHQADQRESTSGIVQARIINGTPAGGYFPSVGIVGDSTRGFCSGTLIGSRYVLTAGHCGQGVAGTAGRFYIGGTTYATSRIVVQPGYNRNRIGEDGANDLAIFVLNRDVVGIPPSPIYRGAPRIGQMLFLVGFGAGGTGNTGQQGDFGTKRVGSTWIDGVTSKLIVWRFDANNESNTAPGDSGGPAFLNVGGVYFVAGVTSGGTSANAAIGDFSFDTRIDAYAGWIDSIVGQRAPAAPPPDDYGNTQTTARVLNGGDGARASVHGNIEVGSDVDVFKFVAPKTGLLTVFLGASGTNLDPVLTIFDDSGHPLAQNDDYDGGNNSRIQLNVAQGRTYFIVAHSYGNTTGAYSLQLNGLVQARISLAMLKAREHLFGEVWSGE